MKEALTTTPVLALPDCTKPFVLESDASGVRMGAMLRQQIHLIAYISRMLNARDQRLLGYEKELLAIVYVMQEWRMYLVGVQFVIRTYHFSLKYLLKKKHFQASLGYVAYQVDEIRLYH